MSEVIEAAPVAAEPVPEVPAMAQGVLLDAACDVTAFCAPEKMRYALNAVHVRPADGIVEATDGRVMIQVPLPDQSAAGDYPLTPGQGTPPGEVLIPCDALTRALKSAPKKSPKAILRNVMLTAAPNGRDVVLTTTDCDIAQDLTAHQIDGKFPDTMCCFPPPEKCKGRVMVNATHLGRVLDYVQRVNRDDDKCVTIEFFGPNAPIICRFAVAGREKKARALVMNMIDAPPTLPSDMIDGGGI